VDGPSFSGSSANRDSYAFAVLGEELAREAFAALGKATKITFGQTGSEHTLTERRLGNEDLVDRIRRKLDNVGRINKGERTIYFSKKFEGLESCKPEAVYLMSKGFSLTEIADALAVTAQTLNRWGIRTPRPWFNISEKFTEDEIKKLEEAGKAWIEKISPNTKRSAYSDHYALVGAARAYLKNYRKKNNKEAV
jgi:hypothetical protein